MRVYRNAMIMSAWLIMVPLRADPLNQAIDTETRTLKNAAASQRRIDRLDDASRRMFDDYRRTLREIDTLKVYVSHLKTLIASQRQEKREMAHQIQEIARAEREIVPLMIRMVETLERFVQLDTPFLPEERRQRIEQLKQLLSSAEATTAEKFRRILEAYQIENDYARTIEAYRAELKLEDGERPVDFLRLGRVALFYQTLDGEQSGFWNPHKKAWETLPDDFRRPIRQGLRVARKEAAPDLLTLPIPAPGTVQ